MKPPRILASATRHDTERLSKDGPRRDFVELARAIGATIDYLPRRRQSRGAVHKLFGEHVRQAWQVAGTAEPKQVIFADGEHNGIPLLFFLFLRRKRRQRVVILGHFVSKAWKRWLLRVGTHLVPSGALVLHSVVQKEHVRRAIGEGWRVHTVPYHVDTEFWSSRRRAPCSRRPVFVAVGAESRDYTTLLTAAAHVDGDIVIAGGSHWARNTSEVAPAGDSVRFVAEVLGFAELRELYARARAVVVPLQDVQNQSGITTILEAMSMGVPVIVSATTGQREAVRGPLVTSNAYAAQNLEERGVHVLLPDAPATMPPNGLYVPPGDPAALAAAMNLLAHDAPLAARIGGQARIDAARSLDTTHYVERLASILGEQANASAGVD